MTEWLAQPARPGAPAAGRGARPMTAAPGTVPVAALVAPCLAAAALAVPFGSLLALPIGPGALTITPLLLALAAVPWLVAALARRRLPAWRLPVVPALAVFVAALALAAWPAPDLARAVVEIARWLELGLAMVLAGALGGAGAGARAQRLVLAAVLAAGVAEAAVGLWGAWQRVGPESFAILAGRLFRAYGTFGQPNPFGGYMNLVWPVGAALALAGMAPVRVGAAWARPGPGASPGAGPGPGAGPVPVPVGSARGAARLARPPVCPTWARGPWAVAGLIVAGTCGAGLVLSWSRGAWLAAACAAAAMAATWLVGVLRPPVSRRAVTVLTVAALGSGGVLLAGGARVPAAVGGRLASVVQTFTVWGVGDAEVDEASFATLERVAHWEAAAAMWSDRPWLGQGPGHFELAYPQYRLPRWPDALGHAHNAYLHLLAESGLVGLAGYLVFLLAAVRLALNAALRPTSSLHGALGLGLVGVLAALSFHSLVDWLFVHDLTVQLGLLIGLTVAAGRAGSRAVRW